MTGAVRGTEIPHTKPSSQKHPNKKSHAALPRSDGGIPISSSGIEDFELTGSGELAEDEASDVEDVDP